MSALTSKNNAVSKAASEAIYRCFANTALILGWTAFWLSTALFPCCDAFAEALDGHLQVATQTTGAAQVTAGSQVSDSAHVDHEPASDCGSMVDPGPPSAGEYASFPTDHPYIDCITRDVLFSFALTGVTEARLVALRDYHPPPPTGRVYLRTRRILI